MIFPDISPFLDGAMWTPMSQLDVDLQSLPTELSEECSLQRAPQGGFLGTEKGSVSREKCGKIQ